MNRSEIQTTIKLWRETREQRLAAEKVADKLKEAETALKNGLIAEIVEGKYEGIVIGGRVTGVSTKEVPVVIDRQVLEKYILDTRNLSLLQFRISTSAVAEVGEVPGVGTATVFDLFDRKV